MICESRTCSKPGTHRNLINRWVCDIHYDCGEVCCL